MVVSGGDVVSEAVVDGSRSAIVGDRDMTAGLSPYLATTLAKCSGSVYCSSGG
jgi:hypothetical protein